MKWMRGVVGAIAAALLMGSAVRADDAAEMRQALDNMKREMADMKAQIAERESVKESAGGAAPTELTTMNGYKMTIGGEIINEYRFEHGATDAQQSDKYTNRAGWGLNSVAMWFDVKTSDVTNLHVKLDLDDTATNGALVEEAYYDWKKLLDGNLGLRVGKHEIAYGLPDANLGSNSIYSVVHGRAGRGAGSAGNNMVLNGTGIHAIGEIDNALGTNLNYKVKDWARVDFTVFSNQFAEATENKLTGDNGLNSFATQLTLTPTEKIKAYLGFVHLTNEIGDTNDYMHADSNTAYQSGRYYRTSDGVRNGSDNTMEMSAGVNYALTDKWNVFTQYLHTWNAGYVSKATANDYQIGAKYKWTKALTVGAMFDIERVNPVGYEMAMLSDTDARTTYNAAIDQENYYRAMFVAEYRFTNGILVGAEYAHEWYDAKFGTPMDNITGSSNGSKGAREADQFVLWTGVQF